MRGSYTFFISLTFMPCICAMRNKLVVLMNVVREIFGVVDGYSRDGVIHAVFKDRRESITSAMEMYKLGIHQLPLEKLGLPEHIIYVCQPAIISQRLAWKARAHCCLSQLNSDLFSSQTELCVDIFMNYLSQMILHYYTITTNFSELLTETELDYVVNSNIMNIGNIENTTERKQSHCMHVTYETDHNYCMNVSKQPHKQMQQKST